MPDANFTLPSPVLVLEDDPSMQQRLVVVLQQLGYPMDSLCLAQTLAQAMHLLANQPIALALVDFGLPDGNGLEFIEALRKADPSSLILVISAWSTQDTILSAIQAGATGYVLKERDDIEISLSIKSIMRGGAPIDPFIAQQILSQLVFNMPDSQAPVTEPVVALSPKELEILQLVAQGLSNREIAEHFSLSRYTVEGHIKNIYRKLSVNSRSKAIHTARSIGLL